MAYDEYRGRSIGRLMYFLYKMTSHSDNWCFGDHTISSGINGKKIGTWSWKEGTDTPIFKFTDAPGYSSDSKRWILYMNGEVQDRAIKECLDVEAYIQNVKDDVYALLEEKPYFQFSPILWHNDHLIGWSLKEVAEGKQLGPKSGMFHLPEKTLRGSGDRDLISRLTAFSCYPSQMEIRDNKGKCLFTVADAMKWQPLDFNLEK